MGIMIGVVATLVTILFNLFVNPVLQGAFGPIGVAFTEIGFALIALATAVIYIVWKRRDLDRRHIEYGESDYTVESVFSFKLPKFGHIVGGMMLMFAGYLLSTMYYNIVIRLCPEAYTTLTDSISNTYSGTFLATFCTIAVVPPVCEELLLRGAIQKTFSDLPKPIHTILLSGLMFGLFHIDPIRIPFATMMGIILSYAYYRSGSILVPILMHFANNAYSFVTSWQFKDESIAALLEQTTAAATGSFAEIFSGILAAAAFAFIALFAALAGVSFFEPNLIESVQKHRHVFTAVIITIFALGIGMAVSILVFGY